MKISTLIIGCCLSGPVFAEMSTCTLNYQIKGWSFIYAEAKGTGTVRCRNGQTAAVTINIIGGGATIGKSEIHKGKGAISHVRGIGEVYGTYIYMDGHAGVARSAEGRIMTKGEVSLALSGYGRGVDFGLTLGAFTIRPR